MEKGFNRKVDSTFSELVAAAGKLAFEYSDNDREAYELARFALIEIVKKTAHPIDLDKEFESLTSSSQLLH